MSHQNTYLPKPLFASAATISSTLQTEERKKKPNDLENLNLNLASSTLDAILAVQQLPYKTVCPDSTSDGDITSTEVDEKVPYALQLISGGKDEDTDVEPLPVLKRKRSRSRSRERHRKKPKKKHKHKKHHRQISSPENKNLQEVPQVHKGKVFLEDIPNLYAEHAFRVDRIPNKDLKTYESLSKRHIAKYKLNYRACFGNPKITIDYLGMDKPDKSKKKRNSSRYFSKDSLKQTKCQGFSCHSDQSSLKVNIQAEFIKISKEDKEKQKSNALGSYSCLDEATASYVHGKSKPTVEHELQGDIIMDDIFEKVAQFNQKTREDPNNVNLWLDFVKFQTVVDLEDKSFKKQVRDLYDVYRPPKSVIEKQLSILEKAIELNPSSLELKQKQLELYQDVWESDKVEKAWEDLLFVHSSNVNLWRHYLSRQQSCLKTFSFTRVVKKYHHCFRTLIRILEEDVKVVNKSDHIEEKLLGLFYQYCTFLHQSGYTERAVTSFQAIIEMNLFCPPSLNLSSTKERLAKLESFWESSTPKFGDLQARGWSEWETNQEERNKDVGFLPVSTEDEEDQLVMGSFPKYQTWLRMEKARQDTYWLPWKPDQAKGETEDNCEDLDRLVLFEDISPALFRVTTSEACIQLVCLFLTFLGMKSCRIENILCGVEGYETSEFGGYLLTNLYQIQSVFNLKLSTDIGENWRPHQCLIEFVNQIILQAEKFFSSSNREVFTLLHLDLELQKTGLSDIQAMLGDSKKTIKKFGKNLLKEKQNRNNLVLWDAYIRILWVLSDKIEETISMVDTALAMFSGSHSIADISKAKGICLLCRTYSEIMLNFEPLEYVSVRGRHTAPSREDKDKVIACIGALVKGSKFKSHLKVESSPLYVLKVRKRMINILESFISSLKTNETSMNFSAVDVFVQCYALFEFCTSGFHTGNEVFISAQNSIKDIQKESSFVRNKSAWLLKNVYISHLTFISNVMNIQSISLSYLRSVLDNALRDFPYNGHFHRVFRTVESGSFLVGRMRRFYDSQLKSSPASSTTVFALVSELTRLQTLSRREFALSGVSDLGLVHRIRSLFEHTLELPACSQCPLLWRMWLAFETQFGTPSQTKGILYRALQCCPWAKSIYTTGVACLGAEELQEMSDLMTEKEIRICMPLEEVELLLHAEKESADEQESQDDEDDKDVF